MSNCQLLRTNVRLIVIICGIALLFSCKPSRVNRIDLDSGWKFREAGTEINYPATVPGSVHTDLMTGGLIPDPFFGVNEKKVQWVERKNWEYTLDFECMPDFFVNDNIDLVFEGLDTYADVFLNDSLVLEAGNMFRRWEVPCTSILKDGKNTLRVLFSSPVIHDSLSALASSVRYPDNRAFSRKAPYQYGWDWGPRLVTSGIWKPIYLTGWKGVNLRDVQFFTLRVSDSLAFLKAELFVLSDENRECSVSIKETATGQEYAGTKTDLVQGENNVVVFFEITAPRLWWTNGLGEPNLYDLEIEIASGSFKETKTRRIGVRTIELVQEPDSIGKSFFFKVNGIPVFMKGANYIPQDNFPARVDEERYRHTIASARIANMNMLRVWGGGFYENDLFYDLCDENGILVWQDFMFACNLYPGDDVFMENVRQEAIDNICRLRNHPCLAIWCGNNEVDEGWHNWGWQKQLGYTPADSASVWHDYLSLFEELLPSVVDTYDPGRPYWPSSPKTGWGRVEALLEGDMHYWGVWWGAEPFEVYKKKVGRFMSEYGFQAFPAEKTIREMLAPEDMHQNSEALHTHQKHPRGMQLIQDYMEREYVAPADFTDYAYVSQLVQAYGITKAIEAHRRAMPYCMGTLYWQLNDCWPVISWSGVDYYGRWKALHWFVKKAYNEVLLSFEENKNNLDLYCVSDKLDSLSATLLWQIMDFSGEVIEEKNVKVAIGPMTSERIFSSSEIDVSRAQNTLLYACLKTGDDTVAENIYYFVVPKHLELPETEIKMKILPEEKGCIIELRSDKLAKNVYLEPTELDGVLSDNYFDLLPGRTKKVRFFAGGNHKPEVNNFRIKTLRNTY